MEQGEMRDLQDPRIRIIALYKFTLAEKVKYDQIRAGLNFRIAKCHARCSRDAFNELCRETDPEAGTFMQKFSEEILGALNDDLKQFGMRKLMKGIIPKECHFVFYPEQLFSESTTTESESSAEEDSKMRNLFSDCKLYFVHRSVS